MLGDKSFTLATANDQIIFIIDGTRVGDVRVYEDTVMQTVIQRWGTGGGNVPAIAYDEFNNSISDIHHTLRAGTKQSTGVMTFWDGSDVAQSVTTTSNEQRMPDKGRMQMVNDESVVRRLTPMECERLQGFPDNHTAERFDFKKNQVIEQADSVRYKQMGNAVAVPVVEWIAKRLVAAHQNSEAVHSE